MISLFYDILIIVMFLYRLHSVTRYFLNFKFLNFSKVLRPHFRFSFILIFLYSMVLAILKAFLRTFSRMEVLFLIYEGFKFYM